MDVRFLLSPAAAILLSTLSCSTGPSRPQPGTPPFYWEAARERFQAGDYGKAAEHLERLTRSPGEYGDRAHPMRLVVLSGLMQGHKDLAEQYEMGAEKNRANPTPFYRRVTDNLSLASRFALQLGEAYGEFEKAIQGPDIVLGFAFPSRGTLSLAPQMLRVAQGAVLPDSELSDAQTAMLQRGVFRAVCRATGSPGDPPKAMELLKSPPVPVSRATFLGGMGLSLFEASVLFGDKRGNQPDRQNHLLGQAEGAIQAAGKDAVDQETRKRMESDRKRLDRILK